MSQPNNVNPTFVPNEHILTVPLSILVWEDHSIHYIYSPALDLTGYGTSKAEAQESFEVTVDEFLRYTELNKTIYEELKRLGWTVDKSKMQVYPPDDAGMRKNNETYSEICRMSGVSRHNTDINITLG